MVKPGYKQTEIGVIPENWEVGAIGSVCTSVAVGGNYQNSATPSDYPLIKMGNLSRGNITLEKVEYIKATIPDQKDLLHYGDVLFNTRNTPELVGKVAIWRNELPRAYYNSNLLRFVFDTEKADSFYMNLALNTEKTVSAFRNIAKGTTSVAAIYPQDLLKVIIPIPPLAEQHRIAEALSDMDELIASLEKLIAKKKAIKQGAMQELLTGKRRLPGFTGEWESVSLSEIGHFIKGSGISRADANSGKLPAVRYGELYTKHDNYLKEYYSHISFDVAQTAVPVTYGAILFAASGETKEEIGKCAAIIDDHIVYAGGDILIFVPDKPIHPVFFGTLLNSPEVCKQKAQRGQGDAIVHIHADSLSKIRVTIPDYEEQTAIAELLLSTDREIDLLETEVTKARKIKQGMMQQLLTGKMRLL